MDRNRVILGSVLTGLAVMALSNAALAQGIGGEGIMGTPPGPGQTVLETANMMELG